MSFRLMLMVLLVVVVSGCVSSRTIVERQIGDDQLACAEIAERIGELDGLKTLAEAESGVSGKNVAAGLLFWPAIIGNQMKAGDNIETVNNRKAVLVGYYQDRSCSNAIPSFTADEIKTKIKNDELKELQG